MPNWKKVIVSGSAANLSTLTIDNTTTGDSLLLTTTENSSTAAPVITLKRNSNSPANADYLGQIKFKGENDADQEVVYAKITGKIQDDTDGTEDGLIEIANRKAGSNNIGVIKYSITSLNKKIKIKILPSIDINIKNNDANWNQPFIETLGIETNDNYSKVNSKVINSDFQIATFFKTKYFINSNEVRTTYNKSNVKNLIGSSTF